MQTRTAIMILIIVGIIVFGGMYLLYQNNYAKNAALPSANQPAGLKLEEKNNGVISAIDQRRQNLDKAQAWLDNNKNNLTIEQKRQNLEKALNNLNQ